MNIWDILILALIGIALVIACREAFGRPAKGHGGCAGDCSKCRHHCGGSHGC